MSDNRTLAKGAMIGGAPIYYQEESTTDTTMPSTSFFKTEDVDGKPVTISRDNIMGIVKDCLGTILNGLSNQTTVTKVPTLNGDTLGASTAATLASVLGAIQPIGAYSDPNSITKTCIAYCSSSSTIPNNPGGERYGILVTINNVSSAGYSVLQLFFTRSSGAFYWRSKPYNEEWSAQTWYKIQGE